MQAGLEACLAKRPDRAHSFVGKIESGERQLNVLEYVDALGADAAEIIRAVVKARVPREIQPRWPTHLP
jgi:hypothetical protein